MPARTPAAEPARTRPTRDPLKARWALVPAAVLMQLALGAIYAWSVFNRPLQAQFGWSPAQAVLPFEVAVGTIFIGSLIGGRIQDRKGPRPVALAGGLLYALGTMLGSLVHRSDQLWLLVSTCGAMAGIGMGAAYITPIAMLAKWFPDKRGLITGLAVGGFGFGSVITAPVAQRLMNPNDVTQTFLPLGLGYLVAVLLGASFFRNPPEHYAVPAAHAAARPVRAVEAEALVVGEARQFTLREALRMPQWYLLTAILFLNVTAGISLISQLSPAAQAITGVSAEQASVLVGVMGLLNGAGRIGWAAVSDHVGRMPAFLGMLGLQAVSFFLLPHAVAFMLFALLAGVIYFCYGGGFGTMPATAADFFGTRHAGAVYGAMIIAWSLGGVVGPLLTAKLLEASGSFVLPFTVVGGIAAGGLVLPLLTRPPAGRPVDETGRRVPSGALRPART